MGELTPKFDDVIAFRNALNSELEKTGTSERVWARRLGARASVGMTGETFFSGPMTQVCLFMQNMLEKLKGE